MAGEAMILSVIENLERWLLKKADADNKKLSSLVVEEANLRRLVVWLLEIWEDKKENLYSLLAIMVDPFDTKKLQWLLVEKADLWEDKGCNFNKEKLHSLVSDVAEYTLCPYDCLSYGAMDTWEDSNGQLKKEKLYGRVADIKENLDCFIDDVATRFPRGDEQEMGLHEMICMEVEEVKDELRVIVDLLELEGLHYFISDVVEMAHSAQLLIRLLDSDPFHLYLRISNCILVDQEAYVMGFDEHPLMELLKKTQSIKLWLQQTKGRMLEFGVERAESSQTNVGEEFVSPTNPDVVVGLEEDVESMLRRIDNYACLYISGVSGIGKTTLARILYHHQTVVDQYECRAWVCLSPRKLSRKELLIKLIQQVVDSKRFKRDDDNNDDDDDMLIEKMDNRRLRQILHQQLKGKRHFIVFDDLSENAYLRYVFQALPKEASRYTLLFTTRIVDTSIKEFIHKAHRMKFLDVDKSWQLLLKTILFGSSDDKFPKQLEKKGREILMRMCGGLPLAIKELGWQWAEKRRSGSEWEQILQSLTDLDLSATLKALESTYLSLDPETKSCFLRLAFFKEGSTIKRAKMIQICTLVGMEKDQCNGGLMNLALQSIIEFKKVVYPLGAVLKRLSINALFQRLAIRKAKDELGFEIRRKDGNNRASHEPRHRVVYCSREKFDYRSSQDERHLVSLFFHGGSHFDWTIHHFEQLKVLDMEDFGLKILPETVGELSELRYLGLRNNYIKELPHSLGRMKKLEVLDIALNFMVQVPDIIWEIDSLRHLYMSDIICRNPLKIDALKHLQTLAYIPVNNWTYEFSGLKLMTSLYRLGVEEFDESSNVSKLFASLAELENLQSLILKGFRFKSMPSLDELGLFQKLTTLILKGRLTRLPSTNNFPPNICYLRLINSCLDEDPMPILEKVEGLNYLIRLQNAYTGRHMVISASHFISLQSLIIEELWHLRNLQVGEGALHNVWELEIHTCPHLETISEEIWSIKRLKELKMVTTNRTSFAELKKWISHLKRC